MGRQAECTLLATKTVVAESSRPVYSHCAIIEAPLDLPDGDYEVEFGGEVGITTRRGGSWLVGSLLPKTYQEAAQFYASGLPTPDGQAGTRKKADLKKLKIAP